MITATLTEYKAIDVFPDRETKEYPPGADWMCLIVLGDILKELKKLNKILEGKSKGWYKG